MLEIPESYTLANQMNNTIKGKIISYVQANHSPHSFAWYHGKPEDYNELLSGKTIGNSNPISGMLEIEVEDCRIVFTDGVTPRYYYDLKKVPKKHQLYLEFDDNTALVCTIQMYGGLWAFRDGEFDNMYYIGAKTKPSPLSDRFDRQYFESLRSEGTDKLSAKAFLATEQRIPGLGNGVLQDILYLSGIHPKRKMMDVTDGEYDNLFDIIKKTLRRMADQGGRDTEKDLFGNFGEYQTYLSKKTAFTPCVNCGYELHKGNYMGGTIYYCEHCQS
ncbi:MAG: endonuclease VIII [Clostridiales bacterium]|jgi:formamidopyrimidine-DNA glycosylase|nr:endonuclease VIII [Clostridiales bacterium]